MKRVIVVGGGLAGLTAAHRLRGKAHVEILEASDRPGGVAVTERRDGFLIEGGPDSFLSTKPWAADLCRELGLQDEIIPPSSRTVYVLWRRRLHPLPDGMFLAVPTRALPLLWSPLLSLPGKIRMLLDLVLPRGEPVEDESIGSFVRRRLGAEAVEKLAEPLMAGLYLAEADRLSLRATFPRFIDLEREHRSLIRGLRRAKVAGHVSPFVSLRGGIGTLVDALVRAMPDVTIRTKTEVRAVDPGFSIRLADGRLQADAVVMAVPPPACARLLRGAHPLLADAVSAIPAVGSVTVSLGYRRARLPSGTGFVIPRREGRRIVACSWSSQKFEGRAPAGGTLVRCFLTDLAADPVAVAREELRGILSIDEEPVVARAFRWPEANPVYEVGHARRVARVEELTPPGLYLTGAGFRGIGLPDTIHDATRTAERVAAAL